MIEVNKFGVVGLMHFQKAILLSHVSKFSFQKLQYLNSPFKAIGFWYRKKRLIY